MDDWPLAVVVVGCSLIWAVTLWVVTRDVERGWAVVMTGLIDHTTCIAVAKTDVESEAPDQGAAVGFSAGVDEDDDDDDDELEHGESYAPTCKPRKLGF